MSEENKTLLDVDVLPGKSEVQITVPVDIYQRLQSMIFTCFPFKDITHFNEVLAKIHKNEYTGDQLAYHFHTILWLCDQVEQEANKKGMMVKKKYDLATGKVID